MFLVLPHEMQTRERRAGLGSDNLTNTVPSVQFSSVQFSSSVVSDSLQHHEPQHARPPCPLPTPGVYPNS